MSNKLLPHINAMAIFFTLEHINQGYLQKVPSKAFWKSTTKEQEASKY